MHELVLRGGRVIDPESGHDATADIAISAGRIVEIGTSIGPGTREIGADGLVVSPGFVDLHAHGQSIPADRMQAFDGVTTALELELGVAPVNRWYADQAVLGRVLNYGASCGWVFSRIATMTMQQPESSVEGLGLAMRQLDWVENVSTPLQTEKILELVRTGLAEGGIGIGFPIGYAPATGAKEISALCRLAAEFDVPTYTHIANLSNVDPRSSIEAYIQLIGHAGSTGAHMHICHFNSTSLQDVELAAQLVRTAQAQGLKITIEAYPYGTGSTVVGATFFTDPAFSVRTGGGYEAIRLAATGGRFESRDQLLAAGEIDPSALVLWTFLDVEASQRDRHLLDQSVLFPGGAIASDAVPWSLDGAVYNGLDWPLPERAVAHPRSSGTFTRFLRQWVRERNMLPLIDGIRKCTLIPAQILEFSTPQMRRKGRIQPGCDADIVAFEYGRLTDNATFKHMNLPAEGMVHVLVNGDPVITNGQLDLNARPGKPIRRPST